MTAGLLFLLIIFLAGRALFVLLKTDEPEGKDTGLYCPMCGQKVHKKR